jgi:hypothetical protein
MVWWLPAAPLRRLVGGSASELIVEPRKLLTAGWSPAGDTPTMLAALVK